MLHVAPGIEVDEGELQWEFVRASGPGGQNVNKVATAVQVRWDVTATTAIGDEVKTRLRKFAGARLTADGVLILESSATRSQMRNRELALAELIALIRKASVRPKKRRATKPTAASREERLARKVRRGQIKRGRRAVGRDDE